MPSQGYDYVIVGAGLAGLSLASQLTSLNQNLKILILEKSKSCGGRMATRRIGSSKYDHGAQFIKRSKASEKLIDFWLKEKAAVKFPSPEMEAFCGASGMTQLAKKIAENLNISYEHKVIKLQRSAGGWGLVVEGGESILSQQIILTCPLPQSLELLSQSDINFDQSLSQLSYSKALVALVELDSELSSEMNYVENWMPGLFSICSQKAKGLSSKAEYTVVMDHSWSELHFDKTEDEIAKVATDFLISKLESKKVLNIQIKKWRYCQPQKTAIRLFENPEPGVYLIGDAFGGPSLNGALRSSEGLFEQLSKRLSE